MTKGEEVKLGGTLQNSSCVKAATTNILYSITAFYSYLLCVLLILLQIPLDLVNV
jgi:hypothetical protein